MPAFTGLVLLDPFLLAIEQTQILTLRTKLVKRAAARRNWWASLEDAEKDLRRRPWDERVRRLYLVSMSRLHIYVNFCTQPRDGITGIWDSQVHEWHSVYLGVYA